MELYAPLPLNGYAYFAVSIRYYLHRRNFICCIASAVLLKLQKGKRLFKMSPIHHHFEMCGWSEIKICGVFSLVTVIFGILSLVWVIFWCLKNNLLHMHKRREEISYE